MAGDRRTAGSLIGGALLNIAALGGLVCIVLVVLAAFANVSLIMFKTGSMSPTIPAGSVALVREIPASEIEVGDVLTVDRPGMLPVTHRVTSVSGTGETRELTMRGDANEAEDPLPYTVTEVRRVLASVPHLAHVIVWFSNPWVLGGLTISASILVTWAFWPRQARPGRRASHGRRGERAGPAGAALGAVVLGAAVALLPLPADGAAAASRDPEPVVIRSAQITLTSIGDADAMRAMRPGVPVEWQVGVQVAAAEPGAVGVSLEAEGSEDLTVMLDVRACSVTWKQGVCDGIESAVGGGGMVDVTAGATHLTSLGHVDERWLLLTATVPELARGTVELTVRAAGGGDAVSTDPGERPGAGPRPGVIGIAHTGIGPAWILAACSIGAGLCAAGIAGMVRRKRPAEAW